MLFFKNKIFFITLIYLLLVFLPAPAAEANSNLNILVVSDIHLNSNARNTMDLAPMGFNGKNDLDPATFKRLITVLKNNIQNGTIKKPDMMVVLGDVAGHRRLNSNPMRDESIVFKTLKKNFSNLPIFYVFGNNDSLQSNYGPFTHRIRQGRPRSAYDIAIQKGGWANGFLSTGQHCAGDAKRFPCLLSENSSEGYYAAWMAPHFRWIGLNTVVFSEKRPFFSEKQARLELDWLSAQLKSAQKNNDFVLLGMHIPPGRNVFTHFLFWEPKDHELFLRLIREYSDRILGLFASHTHMEEWKLIEGPSGAPLAAVYFTPALSTSHGNAPSVKAFYFSNENKKITLFDYETFYFFEKDGEVKLGPLYRFRQAYCHQNTEDALSCLRNVRGNVTTMKRYFSAGNSNFVGYLFFPGDVVI